MIRQRVRRRGGTDPVFSALCALSVRAGLHPLAWLEMTLADFSRVLARRGAS